MWFPDVPDVPATQRATGKHSLRYEDVAQDGRILCLALAPTLGSVAWRNLFRQHPLTEMGHEKGVIPILTRLVLEGGRGPFSVRRSLEGRGGYQLAHTRDEAGSVNRIVMCLWTEAWGTKGRTHGPPPDGAGEPLLAGRVFGEHVFTRPFAPREERKVLRLDHPGLPDIPDAEYRWRPLEELLEAPAGAQPLDAGPALDPSEVAFGLHHTDSNQHVNSLVYPRLFEDAALRHLQRHGLDSRVLSRFVEVAYRKPCFAGGRARISLRAFRLAGAGGLLVTGAFLPPDDEVPYCTLRLLF